MKNELMTKGVLHYAMFYNGWFFESYAIVLTQTVKSITVWLGEGSTEQCPLSLPPLSPEQPGSHWAELRDKHVAVVVSQSLGGSG